MPDKSGSDQITKAEAAIVYRRSERSLSRDITNAIKFRDVIVLKNVELLLEDGTRRPGSELTIGEIVNLRDRGLNPTWLLQRQWLQKKYGRRDESPPRAQQNSVAEPNAEDDALPSVPLPQDLSQRAVVLMAQNEALKQTNADLRIQTMRLEKELDRRAEERREENELQKQNNVLMQQIYNLLSKMQETPGQINILPAPATVTRPRRTESAITVEGQSTPERKGTVTAKKGGSAKSSRKRSRQPKGGSAQQQPSTPMKKYLPTLDRAVRFFSRK